MLVSIGKVIGSSFQRKLESRGGAVLESSFRWNDGNVVTLSIALFLTIFSFLHFGFTLQGVAVLIYVYALIVLSLIDLRTQTLPDIITKPLIALGLLQGILGIFCSWKESLLGAVLGYGVFWGVNTIFRALRNKEGMGYGDFKLLAAIGAWCGVGQLPLVIIMASCLGIIMMLLAAFILRRPLSEAIPFGPSLAVAGLVSVYFGERVVTGYLSLFGL